MRKIDEWNPVFPKKGGASKTSDGAASVAARRAPDLVGAINRVLMAMKPRPPDAVHFFLGEGLRWIRVGFDGNETIAPSAVGEVGKVIASCLGPSEPLFFNALRPHDMLFFLEGGDPESVGMPADYFGTPFDEVLRAWGSSPSAASRKRA